MKGFRKTLSLVLAIAMVLTTFSVTVVSAAQYSDTSGHWAESYIDTWSDYGVIQGDGGYFRPDDAITRAEVAQVTQNVISYVDTAENTFVDVSTSDWYADAILKLVAAGALTGNDDGTMAPNNYMTREEAMTMLARAYGLTVENSSAAITKYADYQSISDYAAGYVGTMTSNGFVGGYEDGTIRPQACISRAEFVKLLDNMIEMYITAPGTYGPEKINGIVIVKTGGVTINGVEAKAIVISPQVSGDVTITDSQVSDNIVNLSKNANLSTAATPSATADVTPGTDEVIDPDATKAPQTTPPVRFYGSGKGSSTRKPTATPAPTPVADVEPKDAAFDAASTAAPSITTEITFKYSDDTVTAVRDTFTCVELVKDQDYTISDNKITFTDDFLDSLCNGVHAIEIVTEKSGEGTAPVFELTVTGSTVPTPTPAPTDGPTTEPTEAPTDAPTAEPTEAPTPAPTDAPTETPAEIPTEAPSAEPTEAPTDAPTAEPTEAPTDAPTAEPTEAPTDAPTEAPTDAPTAEPTEAPTPAPTRDPNLPEDKAWVYSDADFRSMVLGAGSGAFGPYNGMSGYGQWTSNGSKATYTHNGTAYSFDKGFNAGSGSTTSKCFYFTPEQACIVTVAYAAQTGRPVYIYQGGVLLASGESGASNGVAATIEADIEDPTAGDVYIYGGSSNKQIYGIFADYYDPSVITYRTLSGKINYTGSADLSNARLVFTDDSDGTRYGTPIGTEYKVSLRQNRNYSISVEVNGEISETLALTLDTNSIAIKKMDTTFDLSLVDIAPTKVTGDVVVHDINNDDTSLDLSKVQITFTATDDPTYTYTTGVTDNKIDVAMMPNHEYAVTATGIDGYTMSALSRTYVMAAGDTNPFKNILFCEDVTEVPFSATIEVGADKAYATINDAITAVTKMKRDAGEAGRVTIVIDPGIYTEQVMVTPSYVTLKAADESNKPEVQWYYGIGYLYYSSDGGYYSEDYAVQKTSKKTVTRWGSACRITGQYVYVENIIFRNTFNCEVTAAELADGVAPAQNNEYSDTNNKPDRTVAGYDARSKTATERAAAIALDGGFTELYRCEFISSQDTFYTNKNAYVKECYIEGGTDFIYGGNAILFEDCTLAWHGYSNESTGGYLTACKTSGVPSADTINTAGYKFVNTTITNSKYYTDNMFAAGSWGRNWGGAECQVVFDGVKMDGVDVPGAWVKMGGDLSSSVLYVNNVTDKNGDAVNVSETAFNPNGTMSANGYTILEDTEFFGGTWVPPHYSKEIELTEYTTEWVFGKSNGAAEYALEGTGATAEIVGTSNAPTQQVLGVDATSGKFNNATRADEWAQVNTGTVFTIPVVNGSVITFGSYGAEILEANGTEFTKDSGFTYVGAGGTVTVTVKSGGYMSYIKVVSPVNPEEYNPTEYSITITEGYTNGTVSVSKTTAVEGETITLTVTPDDVYEIDTYEVKTAGGVDVTVENGSFKMPADNVTVTVTFKKYVQPSQGDTIDYVMPFSANASGSGTTIDGVEISATGTYDLFDKYVQIQNLGYSNSHGAQGSGPIVVQVPGPVEITVGTCAYDDFKLVVKDPEGNPVAEADDIVGSLQPLTAGGNGTYGCYESSGDAVVVNYKGGATTLTIAFEPSTNGNEANARFWLPYLRVKSTQDTPTTEPTTEPTTAPTATASPDPADVPHGWTIGSNGTVTVDEDNAYVCKYAMGESGSGFSYDLLGIMENAPEDLSTADGVITVLYDLWMPADGKASSDFFIDLSADTNIAGWTGGNAGTYGRVSGYGPWTDVKAIAGQTATNSTDASLIKNMGNIRNDDGWSAVTCEIDLKNGTFSVKYNETESGALTGTATLKENALYLNVQPNGATNNDNDVYIKLKNICASYTAAE